MLVYRRHVYLFQMTESDKSFQPRERRGNFLMNKKQSIQFLVAGIMTVLSTSWVSAASGGETDSVSDQKVFELAGVTVEAKRPDWESKLSPGTVTVIRPAEYKGEQKDLPDLLKMVPGVHVREVNGKGQYTVVTVRGSTAPQVGVFVDGVMTNLGGDAAVDISTIPVKNVERIEVYRGYIPARFGGTFIGGVINVVTKKPTKANISAELGKASFGGKSASVEVVAPMKSGSLLFGVNYEKNKGDFPYHNYSYDDPKNQKEVQRVLDEYPNMIESIENSLTLDNWNKSKIEDLYKRGKISEDVRNRYIDSAGKIDNEGWLGFVRNGGLINSYIEMNTQKAKDEFRDTYSKWDNSFADENLKSSATDYYYKSDEDFKKKYDKCTKDMEKLQANLDSGKYKTERKIKLAKRTIQEIKKRQANLVLYNLQDSWDNKTGYFEDSNFATEKNKYPN